MEHLQGENRKPIGRILQDKKPSFLDERIRISKDFTFYGVTQTRAGEAEISIAFKIIKTNGEQYIIDYHELISPKYFDGAGKIKLNTPYLSIVIEGKNLGNLVDYFAEHRVVWLKEPDSDFLKVGEGEVDIESIEVVER